MFGGRSGDGRACTRGIGVVTLRFIKKGDLGGGLAAGDRLLELFELNVEGGSDGLKGRSNGN